MNDRDQVDIKERIVDELRKTAEKAIETDDGSVLSIQEVMRTLQEQLEKRTIPRQRKSVVKEYDQGTITRRQFLHLLGFGVGGAVVSSSGVGYVMGQKVFDHRTPTGHATVSDMTFDTVKSLSPGDDISQHLASNTLIRLQPGTYTINGTVSGQGLTNAGIVGDTDDHREVKLTTDSGSRRILNLGGSNLLLQDFSLDQGNNFDTLLGLVIHENGGESKLVNIEILGTEPTENEAGTDSGNAFSFDINGGDVIADGIKKIGPTHYGPYPTNRGLFWCGRGSTSGSLTLRNLYIENGSGSTIYTGKDQIPVVVETSFFKNALDKMVRLSGQDDAVRGCTFIVDADDMHEDNAFVGSGGGRNATGIWCQSADIPMSGPTIEDCDFIWRQIPDNYNSRGPIWVNNGTGGATIRNCRFTNDTGTDSITAQSPNSNAGDPLEVRIVDCHFTGNGSAHAVNVNGRSGSTMEDCCINMPNGGQVSGVQTTNVNRNGDCDEADPSSPVGEPVSGYGNGSDDSSPC